MPPAFRCLLGFLVHALVCAADEAPPPVQTTAALAVPAHPVDLILGRPTATGITVSVRCDADRDAAIVYGLRGGPLDRTTPVRRFARDETTEVVLTGLTPDTAYAYRFRGAGVEAPESAFHTARPPGRSFTFTVIADSHLDGNTVPALYDRTLANALADAPDFHVDLGDTFMTEKHASRADATRQYLAQRYHLGTLCRSAPLFFVLGNHDGEYPRGRDGESEALWALGMRTRNVPNPLPDGFYTGDEDGRRLQDYYAWEWGDALCVVLDPFWFRQRKAQGHWRRSLGEAQYRWLAQTLAATKARYRFVFIHHLAGGIGDQARGGAEAVPLYEWGGEEADGSDGFARNRPGWPEPVHRLLLRHHVTAVFHGHDHLYAHQERDGLTYQCVPQPGHAGGDTVPRFAAGYGYASGTLLGCSGHLRVAVAPDRTTLSLVRTDGTVADHYDLPPFIAGTATGTAP